MQNNYRKEYFRRARVVAFYLQMVPFVKMVGLNGSLARGEAKPSSDIDFFVVVEKNRIWTGRLLVTLFVQLSGCRRQDEKIAGRICLNRYQTDDFLEIFPHNLYHARDYCGLMPLIDVNGTYQNYIKKNLWTKKFGYPMQENKVLVKKNRFLLLFQKIQEKMLSGGFGDGLEKVLKKYQTQRILKDRRTQTASKGRIRISDRELCFHPEKPLTNRPDKIK